jgi:FXSXX-COOH protein
VPVDGGSPTENQQPEWRSAMLDVSELSLSDLAEGARDDALATALRRVADEVTRPAEPIAGFNSAL